MSIDLAEFDDDFASAEPPRFDEVPDGKYQVRINEVRLGRTRDGSPMIVWDLIVLAGEFANRHIFKNSVVSQKGLPFIKGDLKAVGLELNKLSDLEGHLEELPGVALEVTKRTNGNFTNIYFNRLVDRTPF